MNGTKPHKMAKKDKHFKCDKNHKKIKVKKNQVGLLLIWAKWTKRRHKWPKCY